MSGTDIQYAATLGVPINPLIPGDLRYLLRSRSVISGTNIAYWPLCHACRRMVLAPATVKEKAMFKAGEAMNLRRRVYPYARGMERAVLKEGNAAPRAARCLLHTEMEYTGESKTGCAPELGYTSTSKMATRGTEL
eukprot:3876473-Rhodomonas_salina.1